MTPSVIGAFVRVQALPSGRIQLESSGAHALETAQRVDALGRRDAIARLFGAFVDVDTFVVDLRIAWRAGAFVAARGVEAFVLAAAKIKSE